MPTGKQSAIIIGIDPGLADTGYGIISLQGNSLTALDYGSIKTPKKTDLGERLIILEKELDKIIKKFKPTRAAVEQLFFCKNITTALAVGQARGIILLSLARYGLTPQEFTPLQVKQATVGYGKAEKKQIQQMVKIILNLKEIPRPDDAADALAIAICAANNRF